MSGGIVYYAVMIVAFAIMLWANHKSRSKGLAWGRPVAVVAGLVAVTFAGLAIYNRATGPGRYVDRLQQRETAYTRIAYTRLGSYIGTNFAGKTLVIIRRDSGASAQDDLQIQALTTGLEGRLTPVIESITIGGDMEMPGAGEMFTNAEWERIMAARVPGYRLMQDGDYQLAETPGNPADVVVLSLVGLPYDAPAAFSLWGREEEDRPRLVLANANLYGMRQRIQSRVVAAVLAYKPDADHSPELPVPASPEAAFAQRFLLIDDLNVDEIAAAYPDVFGPTP
jgi:hypothetical protein